MGDADNRGVPPNNLSEALVQQLNSLGLPELKSVLSYVEHRIEALRTPIEEEIEATAAGEVLKIENHGAYALVRKHPPKSDGSGVSTDRVSLYHVRREHRMDGTDSLHWAYLGDVHNAEQLRCGSCGGILDKEAAVCPHCGTENQNNAETEE
ncbi:zinc ribbon domain-containing protein [Haloferax sp. Q22]|uniref:zinc ribbon domain-containing protein n=1 Tax=Haloferax sp. (strain Q22) TaxID=1526048 RepID=UPI000A4D5C98|nr:zinc ribbon domain-containing protein [Haloferax sp. Q22]